MSWRNEIEEIRRREELAKKMGGEERIQRQHDNGRLTVRERIDALVDPGSFHEIGALAGRANYDGQSELKDFTPSNFVLGTADIDGAVSLSVEMTFLCAVGPRMQKSGTNLATARNMLWRCGCPLSVWSMEAVEGVV